MQAPVKHDVQPLTPEQRCETQPASQNMAAVDVNHTPQSMQGAIQVQPVHQTLPAQIEGALSASVPPQIAPQAPAEQVAVAAAPAD